MCSVLASSSTTCLLASSSTTCLLASCTDCARLWFVRCAIRYAANLKGQNGKDVREASERTGASEQLWRTLSSCHLAKSCTLSACHLLSDRLSCLVVCSYLPFHRGLALLLAKLCSRCPQKNTSLPAPPTVCVFVSFLTSTRLESVIHLAGQVWAHVHFRAYWLDGRVSTGYKGGKAPLSLSLSLRLSLVLAQDTRVARRPSRNCSMPLLWTRRMICR